MADEAYERKTEIQAKGMTLNLLIDVVADRLDLDNELPEIE